MSNSSKTLSLSSEVPTIYGTPHTVAGNPSRSIVAPWRRSILTLRERGAVWERKRGQSERGRETKTEKAGRLSADFFYIF